MNIRYHLSGLACIAALVLVGCTGDDGGGDTAAGSTGAGDTATTTMAMTTAVTTMTADTGDTGMVDTGMPDTGMPDTGVTDTGVTDTGVADTGTGTGTATDTGGAGLPATLNIMGYGPHVGNDIYIKVFDDADVEVGALQDVVAVDDTYVIDNAVMEGNTYVVRWWVDFMDNDMCDAPPTDHQWESAPTAADATGLTVDHEHNTDFTDVCSSWD